MRIAAAVTLNPEQRQALEQMARGRSMPARLVERARIELLAAYGMENQQIARRMNTTPKKAARWRNRFLAGGVAALKKDAPRPGRTRTITDGKVKRVVEMTLHHKPANATHWSTRTMARAAAISEASVRRIWRAHGLKPHQVRTFKLSRDPQFTEKLEDIVGLYLNPPEHAVVLCADEKSQIQARPHPAQPADEEGPLRNHDPRLQAQWHCHALCRPGCARRPSDLDVRRPASPSGMVEVPARHR